MAAEGAARVEVHSVSKRFTSGVAEVVAVDGVDLTVEAGSAVSIVGPNGAGKSTLLGMVAGVIMPTEGVVRRTGRTASLLELGAAFHQDLTGRQNLEMGLALVGLSGRERRRRLAEAVEFSGIGDAVDRPVKHLSNGMVARVACAAALVTRPEVLIIDEVLAVGDAEFQRLAVERVLELVEDGSILLLVTHSPELAALATTRTVWLDRGAVWRDGATLDVLREYESTIRGFGVSADATPVTIEDVWIDPPTIEPGDPVRVSAVVACDDGRVPFSAHLELRAAVGDEAFWMRPLEETPEVRELNIIAWSPPVPVEVPGPGRHRIDLAIDSVHVTPTRLEVSLVLTDQRRRIFAQSSCELDIGDVDLRPFYLLRVDADR